MQDKVGAKGKEDDDRGTAARDAKLVTCHDARLLALERHSAASLFPELACGARAPPYHAVLYFTG